MEYRKIQLTGGATYIVSLPNKWIKKKKLKKGSKVGFLETSQGNLLLKIEKEGELKKAKIEITQEMDIEFIIRLLIMKYIQGYDELSLFSSQYIQPNIRKRLKDATKKLIGLESFGETSNELTFRVLLQKDINLLESIQQMCFISSSSLDELLGCLSDKNHDLVNDIIQREMEIDKFYFLVLRQFYLGREDFDIGWFHIAKSIERLSDHIENIAKRSLLLSSKSMEKNGAVLIDLYSSISTLYPQLIELINKRNSFQANEIIKQIKKLQKNEQKDIQKLMGRRSVDPHLILIHESFRRIGSYISDIAEVIINLS